MRSAPPRPTNAELAVLRVLWRRGPSTVREVMAEAEPGTGYTTILKLLQIMTEKGLVMRDGSARTHVFAPAQPKQATQRQILKDLVDRAFGGSAKALVQQALAGTPPSRAELAELREMIKGLEKENSMKTLTLFFDPAFTIPLGMILLHFLWQGVAIAAALALVLRIRQGNSSRERYALCCGAQLMMMMAPLLTWFWLSEEFPGPLRVSANQEPSLPIQSNVGIGAPLESTPLLPPGLLAGLVLAWVGGVLVMGIRLVGGWLRIQQLISRETVRPEHRWQVKLSELQAQMGILRPVLLLESVRVQGPIAIGWLRPVILFPAGLLAGMPPGFVDAILLHELAHIRRNDYLVNLMQRGVEMILFYHPAVWWVSGQIRREREHCCDDCVVEALGEGHTLARALVALSEREPLMGGLALAADGGSVPGRIRRLLSRVVPGTDGGLGRRWRWGWILLGATAVVGLALALPQLIAPKLYQSMVRLRIEPGERWRSAGSLLGEASPWDPYFPVTEALWILSPGNLQGVVSQFDLANGWHLNSPEAALIRLRQRTHITRFRNTSIVEVRVASENPQEAAQLANALAEHFVVYRKNMGRIGLDRVREERERELAGYNELLHKAEDRLFNFLASEPQPPPRQDLAAEAKWIAKREELDEEVRVLRELRQQKRRELLLREFQVTPTSDTTIEIIQLAEPAPRPSRWRSKSPMLMLGAEP